MFKRPRSIALFVLALAFVPTAQAQVIMPTRQHEMLDVELHSLSDAITLYMGDPQELLHMRYRPDDVGPRIEYDSQDHAVLRIRDSYLFREPVPGLDTMPEERRKKYLPDRQTWEIRLYPTGPTKFVLTVDQGEGSFDFTDFQVREVHITGRESKIDVEFARLNAQVLESFQVHVPKGSLEFRELLNARAKEVALYTPESSCRVEVKGKQFEGESHVLFMGPPKDLQLEVSRKIGLRVKGPAATIAQFEAKHMSQSGEEWVSQNYDKARCKVQLTFAEDFPAFRVEWD